MLYRLEWTAESTDDPLNEAQDQVKRARLLMYHDANDTGLRLGEDALDDIEGDTETANAVHGYAHPCGVVVAARDVRPDTGAEYIEQARRLVSAMPGDATCTARSSVR
ncbi:hypothetical protein [Nocardia farcinica]|uniref:hypothetical protein n=1 Tax=Nocardia farcinica TaxID=37329 RepID=UPI0037B8DF36